MLLGVDGIHKAPALIGLLPKSIYDAADEARAIRSCLDSARGVVCPMPLVYGPHLQVLGFAWAESYWGDRICWMPWNRQPLEKLFCGFNTLDDITSAIANGQRFQTSWYKNSNGNSANNCWWDTWPIQGLGAQAGAYTGSANTAFQLDDTLTGSVWHGGNQSTKTKHLISFAARIDNSATSTTIIAYDRVLTYELNAFTANTTQTMTNTLTAQRYNGTGLPGMQISMTCQSTFGATAANLNALTYTRNSDGNNSSMPTDVTIAIQTTAGTPTTTSPARIVAPQTATSSNFSWSPWLPLASGDLGARSVVDYKTSAANSGKFCIALCKPLIWINVPAATVVAEKDLTIQQACLERIYDGACLSFIFQTPNGTAINLQGWMDMVWA